VSPPIRVLHVIDKLSMDGVNPSSCTRLLADWAAYLDPRSVQLSVCTLRDPDPAGTYLEQRQIRVHYVGHGALSWRNIPSITTLVREEAATIVHLHGYSAANFGRIVSRRLGVPNIVHEHAVLRVLPHQYVADYVLASRTYAAVAVSDAVRRFMIRGRSIPPDKIRTIANGIDLATFQNVRADHIRRLRAELGLLDDIRIVGTVTRLREEKGNEYLIRAVPRILEEMPNVVILIVGEGPLRSHLQDLATGLGVGHAVRFLGFRSDVADLLGIFDVLAIPSLTEGFPLSLVEGMAAGKGIVATAVGGMPEVGVDGETVVFVPPRKPKELAEGVLKLLNDSNMCARIARNARESSTRFSIQRSAEELLKLYRDVVPR
jgi:glycosyltransferase involved in cell wall biosynthesis